MPPRRELQMSATRIERDSMGELAVPADPLCGAQTQRAVNNFAISGRGMPPRFINPVLLIKKVAAEVNADLGLLPTGIASAISASVDDLFSDPNCAAHFPVDIFQTGSGRSTNMNYLQPSRVDASARRSHPTIASTAVRVAMTLSQQRSMSVQRSR